MTIIIVAFDDQLRLEVLDSEVENNSLAEYGRKYFSCIDPSLLCVST